MGGLLVDNNVKLFCVGQMKVFKLYVDDGKIKIVGDQWVDGWLLENVLKIMENVLMVNNNKIDVVVVFNDVIVGGVIQVLIVQGLVGKVVIFGQDVDLVGVKCIIFGIQMMIVYKLIIILVINVVEIVVELGNDKQLKVDIMLNNGLKDVFLCLLMLIEVNKENIDVMVIKDGFYKKSEL